MARTRLLIVLGIAGGLAWAAYRLAPMRTRASPAVAVPSVALTATNLDFGEVWEQQRFPWTIAIANPSDTPAEIVRFGGSCGCFKFEPEALTVPARGTAEVKLSIDLRDKPNAPPSKGRKDFEGVILPAVKRGQLTQWTLRGVVKKALIAEPAAFNFGDSLIQGEPFPTRQIAAVPQLPLRAIRAEVDPAYAGTVTVTPPHLSSPDYRVEFTPRADLPLGLIRGEVRLAVEAANGEPLPGMVVPVNGCVCQSIRSEPAGVILGAVEAGVSVERRLVLRSRDGKPFTVTNLTTDVEGLRVEDVPGPSDSVWTLRVEYRFQKAGQIQGSVTARVRHGAKAEYDIRVPVIAYGTATETSRSTKP